MTTQHTPGPWYCPPYSVGGVSRTTVWSGNGDIQIAECKSNGLALAGNRANARLIAAAPELLEALRALVPTLLQWHEEFPDHVGDKEGPAINVARAAIVKALGEQQC